MITTKVLGAQRRKLHIDFDLYTDGDAEFKGELIVLMIDNLVELQGIVRSAAKNNDMKIFHGVCHKVKATVEMLADPDLSQTLVELKVNLADASKVDFLEGVCSEIIESLRQELA